MNQRVKDKALKTLDGMAEMVRAEMVTQGSYITPVVELDRAKAICGGRRACLLGSAWLAYGVKPGPGPSLPGVDEAVRLSFLARRPALRAVYDALNVSAGRLIKGSNYVYVPVRENASAAEYAFESRYLDLDRRALLRLIASARRRIIAA